MCVLNPKLQWRIRVSEECLARQCNAHAELLDVPEIMHGLGQVRVPVIRDTRSSEIVPVHYGPPGLRISIRSENQDTRTGAAVPS